MLILFLCGGSGTRLWPLSRSSIPKQFISFFNDRSLIEETIERVRLINSEKHYLFITNEKLINPLKNILDKSLEKDEYSVLLEPMGRNTAPPIYTGVQWALQKSLLTDETPVLVVSCDHIWDNDMFKNVVEDTMLRLKNSIYTFGIVPTEPHTGFGYIQKESEDFSEKIVCFHEKPSLEKAIEYVNSGNYLWNSGTFLFEAKTMIDEFNKLSDKSFIECAEQNVAAIKEINSNTFIYDVELWKQMKNIAIDVQIMEKTDKGHVVGFNGTWKDIGSWDALHDAQEKDENNNLIQGNVLTYEVKNSYVFQKKSDSDKKKLICLSNVDDLVVVDAGDAIYIGKKSCSQDIKKIIQLIEQSNDSEITKMLVA